MDDWERARAPRRHAPAWLVAAVVAIVVLGIAVNGGALPESSSARDDLVVERGDDDALSAAPAAPPADFDPPAPGEWAKLPAAPIGSRIGHVVADLDHTVVVWGGYQAGRPLNNGALLDARTGVWEAIEDAPAVQRRHVPVAGGRTLYLLDEQSPMSFSLDDGWRTLPAPPLEDTVRLTRAAAWTGRVAVVATAGDDGTAGPLLGWDATLEKWLELAAPPGEVTNDMALVWDARDLLLLGDGGAGFARKLPVGDTDVPSPQAGWEPIDAPDVTPGVLASAGVRSVAAGSVRAGDPVYVWLTRRSPSPQAHARLLAYRGDMPGAPGGWTLLDNPPLDLGAPELVVADDTMVALAPMGVVSLSTRTGTARVLDEPPGIPPYQQRDAAVSGELVVWWGGGAGDGAVWRPAQARRAAALPGICRDGGRGCPLGSVLR